MKKIKITADSTADLPLEAIEKYGVSIMPYNVILGDDTFLDGVNINRQDIYDFVAANKKLPKTAAPSIDAWKEFFNKALLEAENVIHFCISAHLSAGPQNAKIAAENMKNVTVIDTASLSTGIGLAAINAAEMAAAGKSVKEITDKTYQIIPNIQTGFVLDTLEYLSKGGRCSGMTRFLANILKIHPILQLHKGEIKVAGKMRGAMDKIYEKYVLEHLFEKYPNVDTRFASVTHTDCDPEILEKIKTIAKEKFGFEKVFTVGAGCTITCHCGKGCLGLLYISKDEISM